MELRNLRFKPTDIIFDDDITEGSDYTEITGYLWATDNLCKIAEYKGELETEDYINLYPTYNVETDEFYVIVSMLQGTEDIEKKLELTSSETDYIFNKFVEHYWGCEENFNDFVEEWKNGIV